MIIRVVIGVVALLYPLFARELTIGTVSESPNKKIGQFLPVAKYLEKNLTSHGISKVSVLIAKDLESAVKNIQNKKLDILIESLYPTAEVMVKTDITPLWNRWKKGVESYRSIIFVKKESGIEKLSDLKGKTIGFEDSHSTSGYFIPKMDMEAAGLRFSKKPSEQTVGYVFTNDERNTVFWVERGKVDAGVLNEKDLVDIAGKNRGRYRTIYTSEKIPRHIVSVNTTVGKKLRERIREVLTKMRSTDEGRQALKTFAKTKRFTRLTKEQLELIDRTKKSLSGF